MPLTFAHPAAVLPFSRRSKYINFSAMVIGSMSPDFEYFLRGQPMGSTGHSLAGFLTLNLPLVAIVYFIYHYFVHETLLNHLPFFLQESSINRPTSSKGLKIVVFCYSALFGMFTHVAWDSFTHLNGKVVQTFPKIFTHTYTLISYSIPLYKFLQHGSTLFGLLLIASYIFFKAKSQRQVHSKTSFREKGFFWATLCLVTLLIVIAWYAIDYVSISMIGVAVVRVIDSFLLGLLVTSIYLKRGKNSASNSKYNQCI
ncbi:DUF4184 family protein [Mangrovibacillus cuniculi]|uniref:DUF4184 family protein n=1 Tax=Mangrovibacillus cuniculi TaxID=2593652 RepID=A0A7S8CE06_9BACI|nr:DUF4184 family protein [Mangrovibacillus cuniculi]QPC48243.1 DUF4184 family protein [Mangrovibacillus cuniculi]